MAGAVRYEDVIAMTRSGLSDDVISTHVRAHGMAQVATVNDLIWLKQQGVSDNVIRVIQAPPPVPAQPVLVRPAPRPVVVEEFYYGHPYYHHPHYYAPPPPRSGWSIGFYGR